MSYITSVTLLQRCTVNGNAVVEEVDQFPFAAYCIVRMYVVCMYSVLMYVGVGVERETPV